MNILLGFKVNAVTTTRDRAGDELGSVRKVLTMEGLHSADDVGAMLATEQGRTRFRAKYWDNAGELLIPDIGDSAEFARDIIGGECAIQPAGGHSSPMTFSEVDVKRIRITPEAGAKVLLKLAVHIKTDESQEDDETRGALDRMLGTDITLRAERSKSEAERIQKESLAAEAQGDLIQDAEKRAADEKDDRYPEAVKLVRDMERVTVSHLQNDLGIGYNRAARLMDRLLAEGIVGPAADGGVYPVLPEEPGLTITESLAKVEAEDEAEQARKDAAAKGDTLDQQDAADAAINSAPPPARVPGQRQMPKGAH